MPLVTEEFHFTPLPSSSSHQQLQPLSQPPSRPQSPNQGNDAIPDSFLPTDVGDLLSGLGADDLDDFGDIDDEDIGNDRSFEEAHPNKPEFDDGFGGNANVEIPKMVGFATAGGKKLKSPSKEAVAKANKIWAGEDMDDGFEQNKPAKKPRLSDPEEEEDYFPPFDESTIDFPIDHVGFKTGKGKDMAPPRAESLQRASKMFNEIDQATAMDEEPSSSLPSSSFQHSTSMPKLDGSSSRATSIKPLVPSSLKSMQFAAKLFEEVDRDEGFQAPAISLVPPQKSGFSLASGGAAPKISESAMAKAMSILDGDSTPSKRTPQFSSNFHSASNRPSASNNNSEPMTSEAYISETENQPRPNPSSSFKSASGKEAAPLSNASRATVAHLFDDLDTNMATPIRPRPQAQAPAQQRARANSPTTTPFIRQRSSFAQPSTPLRTPVGHSSASLASSKRPIQIKTPSGPIRRVGLGSTPSQRQFKRGFSTPFKTGSASTPILPASIQDPGPSTPRQVTHYRSVFDLQPPSHRQDYKAAFFHPQYYGIDELREMNIPDDLCAIDLDTAPRYRFLAEDDSLLGHADALSILQADGCKFAKAKWVENHWAQILWKLAGQIQARPEIFQEKWCWIEVINQLKYRYEREFGSAERSIIKRIQEHDSSPSLPMILVISGIHRTQVEGKTKYSLDLTDGWYRIKAQIDACLQRAVTKGRLAVGRKIAISGAKLESGNDGQDVLEAFNSSHLIITGNSSSLARWHAKLGKQPQPFIASLSSLSADGGVITLMDVVLEKIFPIAFTDGSGPPWGEEEEQIRQDQWMERYEGEKTRLADKMRKEMEKMQDLASLLAQSAEESDPVNREPPDSLEYDYERLLEAKDALSCLRTMSTYQIVHLASYANVRIMQEMQDKQIEMEAELANLCPKRDVRDFRMIRVVDAQLGNRDPIRVGMLNVWDVKALGDRALQEGKRYLISNIVPGKGGEWTSRRTRTDRAEVYLHTRRDTRWQPVA
ncbi:hypothetical protein L486_01875 [Kwoniella mangroviensis CBS 10435]|uniref:BRCA2 OB1 domain-containing protein n=1 Tax=Kwoniella mangroviensis CBS 10435 TaxID=1331196 RepID=A0A1B9J347_9TREE|nr:hypothetical protein L486_01875 [Kwoniella mangroviensis CBS 10435]